METLVKNMRVRFSGVGEDSQEAPSNVKKLPPQKTQSFKGGKKSQSWIRRQFSGETSRTNDLNDNSEFATAIGAAAFAIYSIEESHAPTKLKEEAEISFTKSTSRKYDDVGRISNNFSGQEANVGKLRSGEASIKKPEAGNQRMLEDWTDSQKMTKKDPAIKRTPTLGDDNHKGTDSTKFGTSVGNRPTVYDTHPASRSGKQKKLTASGIGETKADAWEKAEMTRINKRYERITSKILSWEKEKKVKAKLRMDKIESEIEKRRARASQRYRNDMSRIDQIAGGARAVAEEKRRDEEVKTREKANKIRTTGKTPHTCFCF